MKKAFIYNNEIYFTYLDNAIPKDAFVIEVDDDVTIEELKIENGKIVFKNKNEVLKTLKEKIKQRLILEAKTIISQKLIEKGYYSLSDVLIYKEQNDLEAQQLYDWYIAFDNKIWNFLENEIFSKDLQELKTFDIRRFLNDILQNLEFKI